MSRYALGLEYDGSRYHGWQLQQHAPSIQETLNQALSAVAAQPLQSIAAGRTDAGVHATGQVVHFDSPVARAPRSWLLGVNSDLPADMNVLWAVPVPAAFHARYSARARTYRYVILNRPVRSALARHRAWWVRGALDVESMAGAAQHLVGRHDFSAFRAAACQSRSPVREVRRLEVRQVGDRILIDCEANAFLHHMVRNIVGSLAQIGLGAQQPGWLVELLLSRDRRLAGMTAPPWGLFLTQVSYPDEFELPQPQGSLEDDY